MNDIAANKSDSLAVALMTYYAAEGTQLSARIKLLAKWLRNYPEFWVRLALIESLYQGRYKTVSVEQLLELWQRRGQPICHFNAEFAALICQNIPRELAHFPDEKRDHGFSRKSSSRHPHASVNLASLHEELIPNQPVVDGSQTALATAHTDIEQTILEQQREVSSPPIAPEQEEPLDATVESIAFSQSSAQNLLELDESSLLDLGNLGIDPIHPFVLENELDEFCEKLVAMADQRR